MKMSYIYTTLALMFAVIAYSGSRKGKRKSR